MTLPDTYLIEIRPVLHLSGETTVVPIGELTDPPETKGAVDLPMVVAKFTQMRRDSMMVLDKTQATCYAAALARATAVGLAAPYAVGNAPVMYDHIWINDGWLDATGGQFSFSFPITEQVSSAPPLSQAFERTVLVQTAGGEKSLVYNLLVHVQSKTT